MTYLRVLADGERNRPMSIAGKVAEILSNYEVAFNVGSNDGVVKDDIATVSQLVDVRDPDTDEVLGTVLVPRMRFKITYTQPRMSVGYSYESVSKDAGTATLAFATMLNSPRAIRRVVRDRGDEDWASVWIQRGDPVQIKSSRPQSEEDVRESEEAPTEEESREAPTDNG
jgi:hypothetical protein